MEKTYYSCDGGSLAVYCGGSIIRFSNGYGDGDFKVYKFGNENEFLEYKKEHFEKYGIKDREYYFITCCNFKNAKVLDYDCYHNVDDKKASDNTIMVLNGEYSIYRNYGKVYFVKWGN
jgi:hypothetical protein